MHGHGNRSASTTPRGHIHSTGSSPAPLASAFSTPLDALSGYPQSPAGASHGSPFHLSHKTGGMQRGAGAHTPLMNMHDRGDGMPSAMSALCVHTTAAHDGGGNVHQHARTSPTLHHNALQSIAAEPWNTMHEGCGHQEPDCFHAGCAPLGAVGSSALAYNFNPHGDAESPSRIPEARTSAATAAAAQMQMEDSWRFEELQTALRRRGVGVREEALLSQVLESLQAARAEVRHDPF